MDELKRQVQLINLQGNYDKTLALLVALKLGKMSLEDFELAPGGWNFVERQTPPQATLIQDEQADDPAAKLANE